MRMFSSDRRGALGLRAAIISGIVILLILAITMLFTKATQTPLKEESAMCESETDKTHADGDAIDALVEQRSGNKGTDDATVETLLKSATATDNDNQSAADVKGKGAANADVPSHSLTNVTTTAEGTTATFDLSEASDAVAPVIATAAANYEQKAKGKKSGDDIPDMTEAIRQEIRVWLAVGGVSVPPAERARASLCLDPKTELGDWENIKCLTALVGAVAKRAQPPRSEQIDALVSRIEDSDFGEIGIMAAHAEVLLQLHQMLAGRAGGTLSDEVADTLANAKSHPGGERAVRLLRLSAETLIPLTTNPTKGRKILREALDKNETNSHVYYHILVLLDARARITGLGF